MLLEGQGSLARSAPRLTLGDTGGRSEAWLKNTLFDHPEILPIGDIDPDFGPLIPLCRELRTKAGPVDIAYINTHGRLTLVECKLWRNAEARRKVVAQVLDYARAVSRWSYADLQRQVSAALGVKEDVPYARALATAPDLAEHEFKDAVSRALRSGRLLLLIAGDGIREDLGEIAALISGDPASGFSLGLVEVALYDLGSGGLAVQPRVIARTELIERHVVVLRSEAGVPIDSLSSMDGEPEPSRPPRASSEGARESLKWADYGAWWAPVIAARFDDLDQEAAKLHWKDHIRAPLPWPGTWITAYRSAQQGGRLGLFISGRPTDLTSLKEALASELADILLELPDGTSLIEKSGLFAPTTQRSAADFPDEGAKQAWLAASLNAYVNALGPRAKRLLGPPTVSSAAL